MNLYTLRIVLIGLAFGAFLGACWLTRGGDE